MRRRRRDARAVARSAQSGITAARPASAGYIVAGSLVTTQREGERGERGRCGYCGPAPAHPTQFLENKIERNKLI